ncbi:hypothetical protein DR999_PMT13955 [Platysternon megacephalum]|uniref:Uncharacterized protein n=1 Tax=Platysternon megacephalum TaxID=55544 RepID=A0A4D9DZE6_9SAUR|nr:hypothetical protein DR999_PMT13955 [Platysternon megacephalum]
MAPAVSPAAQRQDLLVQRALDSKAAELTHSRAAASKPGQQRGLSNPAPARRQRAALGGAVLQSRGRRTASSRCFEYSSHSGGNAQFTAEEHYPAVTSTPKEGPEPRKSKPLTPGLIASSAPSLAPPASGAQMGLAPAIALRKRKPKPGQAAAAAGHSARKKLLRVRWGESRPPGETQPVRALRRG